MKYIALVLTLLIGFVNVRAQELSQICSADNVAAVISQIDLPCKFKTDRKTTTESDLDLKKDVHRKLLEGQQLQCGASPDSKAKEVQKCVTIFLCGSRLLTSVKEVAPDWFTVINVPDRLPRGDTRPGSAAAGPTSSSNSSSATKGLIREYDGSPGKTVGYMFRAENPQVAPGKINSSLNAPEKELIAANQARDSGMLLEAMMHYQRAAESNPTDARALLGMANIYSDQRKWEEAAGYYRKAVQSDPSMGSVYSSLSHVLIQSSRDGDKSRLAEAETAARQAVRFQPDNAVAYDLLGQTLEMQKSNLGEAEVAYKKAVQLKPNFGRAHLHLSRLLRNLGKSTEAGQHYAMGVWLSTDPQTSLMIAERLQDANYFEVSVPLIELVLKSQPDNADALYLLSRARVYHNEYAQAAQILEQLSKMSNVTFEVQRLLGFTYLKMEQPENAEKAFLSAAQLASEHQRWLLAGRTGLVGVAESYKKLGRTKDAARVYSTANSLGSDTASRNN